MVQIFKKFESLFSLRVFRSKNNLKTLLSKISFFYLIIRVFLLVLNFVFNKKKDSSPQKRGTVLRQILDLHSEECVQ